MVYTSAVATAAILLGIATIALTWIFLGREGKGETKSVTVSPNTGSASECAFRPGDSVKVVGLQKAGQHNGSVGKVEGFDSTKDRYLVRLQLDTVLKIKAANIVLCDGTAPYPAAKRKPAQRPRPPPASSSSAGATVEMPSTPKPKPEPKSTKKAPKAMYVIPEGLREVVEVRKMYSIFEGGGCAIYIPSLKRERDVLPKHIDTSPSATAAAERLELGALWAPPSGAGYGDCASDLVTRVERLEVGNQMEEARLRAAEGRSGALIRALGSCTYTNTI